MRTIRTGARRRVDHDDRSLSRARSQAGAAETGRPRRTHSGVDEVVDFEAVGACGDGELGDRGGGGGAGGAGQGENRFAGGELEALAFALGGEAGADAFLVADDAAAGDALGFVVPDLAPRPEERPGR